ncbi:MAG: hypothetical protein KJ709_06140 [Nanoarchaeota archaeon]|nr:hypothetical protein [Nanoarchaeota archaeon]
MQKIAIISSTHEPASMNIRENLLELQDFADTGNKYKGNTILSASLGSHDYSLYLLNESVLYADYLDELKADMILFIYSHRSKAGIPSLCVHTPGNWGPADLGGMEKQLCTAPANYIKAIFNGLHKQETDYDVVQEVTHHGPFLKTPCIYVEIGCHEEQWTDKAAGKAVATALLEVLKNPVIEYPSVVGIGGLHTCPNFKKLILSDEFSLGHACPKYNLQNLNEEMLNQALDRTIPKAEQAVLAWKGLGQEKARIIELLESMEIPYSRTR